jgi:hypothetical protein
LAQAAYFERRTKFKNPNFRLSEAPAACPSSGNFAPHVGLSQLKDGYPRPAGRACRVVGEALVRWDEWSDENEWIISRARRLVAAAEVM